MSIEPIRGPGRRPRAIPDLRRYLAARFIVGVATQIQTVAVGWQVFLATGDPFDLGLVALSQFLPFIVLILPAGHVADRYDRRRVQLLTYLLRDRLRRRAAGALAGRRDRHRADLRGDGAVRRRARLQPADRPGAAAEPGADRALPARRGRQLVAGAGRDDRRARGRRRAGAARRRGGLRAGAGPARGRRRAGRRPARWRTDGAVRRSRSRGPRCSRASPSSGRARSCSARSRSTCSRSCSAARPRCCRSTPARSSTSGPVGLGVMRAAPAVGAAVLAAVVAVRPIRRRVGRWMFGGVAAFGVATIVFGLSTSFALSLVALVVMGAGDMVSVYIRHLLVQLETPDAIRGRVSAVNSRLHRCLERARRVRVRRHRRLVGRRARRSSSAAWRRWWWAALWTRLFPVLWHLDRFPSAPPEAVEAGRGPALESAG